MSTTPARRRWGVLVPVLASLIASLTLCAGSPTHATVPARIPELPGPVAPESAQLRISDRHLRTYDAERVTWDDVLDRGRPLPKTTAGCARKWRASGKDPRVDWSTAEYGCLDRLLGGSFKPQGVAGSATTERYLINGRPAVERNLVLTSWYSRAAEPGLFARNQPGESVTQLLVMDLDQRRYGTVELVKPVGSGRLGNLNSHGSGLVWAGQYLYSSSRSMLWMYNADDLLEIGGRYVLPAVGRWSVSGRGGLSSISLDQTTVPTQLVGIDYTKANSATVQSFDLTYYGRLADSTSRTGQQLVLRSTLSPDRRVVRSRSTQIVPGQSFQGVARYGPYTFANSSALHLRGRVLDATVVLRDGQVVDRIRMPHGNGQSIYLDYLRGTYTSITEAGRQFLFTLPLSQLIDSV
jgi:hypothetical protein